MFFLCGNKRLEKEYILVLPFHNRGKLQAQESRKGGNICKFSLTEFLFFFLVNIRIRNLNDP